MKQDNPEQIRLAQELLKELKELRSGTVSDMHKRIANVPSLLKAFIDNYLNCNKTDLSIPRKYRELIFMAIGCVSGTQSTVQTHGRLAIEHGATIEEIGEVLRIVFLVSGVSGLILGAQLFDEIKNE